MTGEELRTLIKINDVRCTKLANILGIVPNSVKRMYQTKEIREDTAQRYINAIKQARADERQRLEEELSKYKDDIIMN